MIAQIVITPKRAILDPQGKAIRSSLHALGFDEVQDVRMGKYLELKIEPGQEASAKERVEAMCQRLLANGVIEDYRFELSEAVGDGA